MGKFAQQLRNFNDKAIGRVGDVFREAVSTEFSHTIMASPVGDPDKWKNPPPKDYEPGTFRANWNITLNAPDYSFSWAKKDAGPVNHTGSGNSESKSEALRVIARADVHDTIYMTNAAPYARRLEFEGWSYSAPMGFVRITADRWDRMVREANADEG